MNERKSELESSTLVLNGQRSLSHARARRQRHYRRVAVVAAAAFAASPVGWASADLISYFDFGTTNSGTATFPINATSGNGSLTYTAVGTSTASLFTGTTTNALSTTSPNGALALAPGNTTASSPYIDFNLSTVGFSAPVITYATQRTGTGFTTQAFSYSIDGGNTFINAGTNTNIPSSFGTTVITIDLSSITDLANRSNIDIRMAFSGATTSSGNNRVDNFQFNASAAGAASGNLTFDPTGGNSRLFTTSASTLNFIDSGTKKDVAFANGNIVTFTDAGVGAVQVDASGVNPAAVNVTNTTGTYTFSGGSIGNNGSSGAATTLAKSGAGTLALTVSNTYTGGTTITGGTLQAATGSLGTGTVTIDAATLQATGTLSTSTSTTIGGLTVGVNGATIDTNGNDVTFGGPTTAGTSTSTTGYSVTKNGSGNLSLGVTTDNTGFIGALTVNAGTVTVIGNSATPKTVTQNGSGTLNGTGLVIGGTASQAVQYDFSRNASSGGTGSITVNPGSRLVAFGASAGVFDNTTIANPVSLVTDGTNVPNLAANQFAVLTVSGPIAGSSGLTVGGTVPSTANVSTGSLIGKVVLAGTNTYSGPTTVAGGTLAVNGSLASAVTVNPASATLNNTALVPTLAGTGTVAGAVVVNGAITGGSGSTANDSTGVLTTTGTQTWKGTGNASSGYIAKISPDGSGNDQLIMSGLTIDGTGGSFAVTLQNTSSGTTLNAGSQYVLAVNKNTAQVGVFSNAIGSTLTLNVGNFVSSDGSALTLAEVDTSTGIELVLNIGTVSTPEPASLLLAGAAIAPLAIRRRRRRVA